jgi:hypothetical protein
LHFGTDWNELDEAVQRFDQEVIALVAAVEANLFAEQTRRDADSYRRCVVADV